MDMGSVGLVPTSTRPSPAVAKAERDVEILKQLARFVIFLGDEEGFDVYESHHRYSDTIPIIAVVGRVATGGVSHLASLLEVGYQRARPYRRVHTKKNQVILYDRVPFHGLSRAQQRLVYPKILECLEVVLRETQSGWKSNESWHLPNGMLVERGVRITVDKRDLWLYREFLREDSRYHQQCFFRPIAKAISWKLQYCGNYSRYRRYPKSVVEAAESLYNSQYRDQPRRFEALLSMMPARRKLLEMALMDLHSFMPRLDDAARLAFIDPARLPGVRHPLFFYYCPEQPSAKKGQHAVNCARFEIVYDRQFKPVHKQSLEPREWKRKRLKGIDEPPF